jgi:hypothetical protein
MRVIRIHSQHAYMVTCCFLSRVCCGHSSSGLNHARRVGAKFVAIALLWSNLLQTQMVCFHPELNLCSSDCRRLRDNISVLGRVDPLLSHKIVSQQSHPNRWITLTDSLALPDSHFWYLRDERPRFSAATRAFSLNERARARPAMRE